jgi:hypothetical protein
MFEGSPGLLKVDISTLLCRISLEILAFFVGRELFVDAVDANIVTVHRRCLADFALGSGKHPRRVGVVQVVLSR